MIKLEVTYKRYSKNFNYLVKAYAHEAFESDDEGLYLISLKEEAYEGNKIITTIMRDLENIRSEVYENKPADDREVWKTLVIKNKEYAQTEKVQQDGERTQQIIKRSAK